MEHELKKGKRYWLLRHPIIFTVLMPLISLFGVAFAGVLIVRTINAVVGLERETGDMLLEVFNPLLRILFGILIYILMKRAYGKDFSFGFSKRNLKQAFLFCIPGFAMGLSNIPEYLSKGADLRTGVTGFLYALLLGFAPGFFEEMALRGAALNNLMIQWKGRPNRVMKSLIISGIAFGVIHLINLIGGQSVPETILQVSYASAVGIMFGAIYLRTKNIIALITVHTFIDFMASIFIETADTPGVTTYSVVSSIVLIIVFTVFGFYLVRKEKREEIEATFFSM